MAPQTEEWVSDSDSQNFSETGFEDAATSPEAAVGLFDKDSDEEELEQLVLGNKISFKESLLKYGDLFEDLGADGGELYSADADTGGLEDVEDRDLFVFDTGVAGSAGGAAKGVASSAKAPKCDVPAWEDSDDERLTVSLASVTRLRKLRITEDDIVSGTEYCTRLRRQYQRLYPAPAWARQSEDRPAKRRRRSSAASDSSSGSDDGDGDDAQPLEAFLRDVKRLAGMGGSTKRRLQPEVLDIQRTRDIPDTHKLAVACLSFHPEYPVLLSASAASVLFLHHIAPDTQPPNPRLTSVQAQQVDVRSAEFLSPRGDKIFFAGRRKYFHQWDLPSGVVQKTTRVLGHSLEHKSMEHFKLSPCGRYMAIVASARKGGGVLNVLSVATTQWIAAARLQSQNGLADFAWWSTGNGITLLGKDGTVGEYSMETKTFVGLWHDDGCVGGIVLALGGHGGPAALGEDRWVAVGSNSGITNIYERQDLLVPGESGPTVKPRPTPKRVLDQLVTPITVLAFSPDGQLLAFGSRAKKDALRLVHLPSCTVYRNWPTQQTPLGRISAVAFGKGSDLLAVGNDIGKTRLWTIQN